LRSLGGAFPEYNNVCETARSHAYDQIDPAPKDLGADGVIGFVRLDRILPGSTEVLAYARRLSSAKSSPGIS